MPALVTRKFRIHNAKQFKESVEESSAWGGATVDGSEGSTSLNDHYYLFIGKTTEWTDDNDPDIPLDTKTENTYSPWDSMISMKKVGYGDISHVIPRYNWTSNTVYSMYTHDDPEMHSNTTSPLIVMTSDFNVYKCLDNANNSVSTSRPISVSTESGAIDDKYGQDNYKWKYLYTITAAEALKFVTPNFIPVKTLRSANSSGFSGSTGIAYDDGSAQYDIETNAVDGSIEVYTVEQKGSGYQFFSGSCLDGVNDSSTTKVVSLTSGVNVTNGVYDNSGIYVNNLVRKVLSYEYDANNSKAIFTLDEALPSAATGAFHVFPQIKVYGDGVGANARCLEGSESGTIGAVFAGDVGANYGSAEVKVIQNGYSASGIGGIVKPIISPKGGHGYDIVEETGANYVMVNSRLEQSENDKFTVSNDFRKLGVIKNPLTANGTHRYTETVGTQAVTVRVGSVSGTGFISDNVIEGQTSGATAKIVDVTDVEVNGVNYKDLRVISIVNGPGLSDRNNGITPVVGSDMTNITGGMVSGIMGGLIDGEGITCSGSTATLISLTAGEMKKYTGDIIYIENRSPVARAADQTEDIKLIIEF